MSEYKNSRIANHLYNKACLLKQPLSGTFELSPLCNMSCNMCYVVKQIAKLHSLDEWYEVAKTAKEEGLFYLLLTGGEPFLIKDFKEFYIKLYQLGLVITINSNATLINKDIIDYLKLYPPQRINVTVYGGCNETYERMCHNPFGFDQMRRGVALLKEAGINVKFNVTLTPDNASDLESIVKYCKDMECPVQFSSYMFPRIRNNEDDFGDNNARFTPEDAAQYYLDFLDYYYGHEEANQKRESIIENGYALDFDCEVDVPGQDSQCAAGRCAWWMSWDGNLSACGMFSHINNNVFEKGFVDCWKTITTTEMKLNITCHSCKNKRICHPCAAISYTETGKFEGVPQYRCEMTQWIIKKILIGR